MTYLEGPRTLIFDSSQPLHEANATYTLMQQAWQRGLHNVWMIRWFYSQYPLQGHGSIEPGHIDSCN